MAELDALMDRWLICTQWAGIWANVTAQSLGGFATRLSECAKTLGTIPDVTGVVAALRAQLDVELKGIEQAAVNGVLAMNADDRQQVRTYYTALWIWNRLDPTRWKQAQLALRLSSRRQSTLEVDHIVACDLWRSKLETLPPAQPKSDDAPNSVSREEAAPRMNELGNCMLLEKNFNISKSNKPLQEFLKGVHEFKEGTMTIDSWAAALDLEMAQVDSSPTSVEALLGLFVQRTQKIKRDLEEFVRGNSARVDLR